MKPLVLIGILSLSVTGCGSLNVIEKDPANPHYMPPEGSIVRINEQLTVPPPWARVFIQRGEVVRYGHLDRYYPSCNFELTTISQRPQIIQPGEYTIIHVARREEYLVRHRPVLYADAADVTLVDRSTDVAEPLMLAEGGEAGSGSMFMHTVRMRLQSTKAQPNMYMLTCRSAQDNPPDVEFVSINEMREALGEKADIILPEAK